MKSKKFTFEGIEVIEKEVQHFKNTGSRVYVPKEWKRVAIVRLE